MQSYDAMMTAMPTDRRKVVGDGFRDASRLRGAARDEALRAWVDAFGDDALTWAAYVADRGGAVTARKIAHELFLKVPLSDEHRARVVGQLLRKKGKLQQSVVAGSWGEGELAPQVAALLGEVSPGAPEGEAKVTLSNIAALSGPPACRQPLFEVLLAHSSAAVRAQAIAELAAIGVVAEDPLRGCPLDEGALRGLLALGARPLRPAAGRSAAEWLSECVRWPSGEARHWHVEGPFLFVGSSAPIEVRERGGEAFMPFTWHEVHQYHFAIAVEDRSSNPAIHEIDHEAWYRGRKWSGFADMAKLLYRR